MQRWMSKSAGALLCSGVLALMACEGTTTVGGGSGGDGGSGGSGSTAGPGSTGTGGTGNASGTGGTGGVVGPVGCGPLSKAEKVDLLFSIDNSRSMADKQEILSLALSDLVQSLVNPPCLDSNGSPVPNQPASGLDACPAGSQRAYAAVTDIHVGVISSSLGGHGADACPNVDNNTCPASSNTSNNDRGRLLNRVDACGGGSVPTYQNKGFLAWDPTAKLNPPGESDPTAFAQNFKDIVIGAGQVGCGYESQLESWYRFLVDPEPYETISVIDGKATPQGIDDVLLAQRADFLRPDSMVVIVNLSDEDDCSIREQGQYFFAAQLKNGNATTFHLPKPRSECATNPNDPCCRSCGQGTPPECPADPTCLNGNGQIVVLTDVEDPVNLRCFDQKRRFGIDFLYPVDRYVQALTSATVPNRAGDLVPNPIFSQGVRDPALVVLTSIVGVPWQDIARDPNDLGKGFKNAAELQQPVAGQASAWDVIIGDPANYVPPADPLMIQSIDPRSGSNPITNDPIVTSQNPLGNAINGHEYSPSDSRDDLQYACIMNIAQARNCGDPSIGLCDCRYPNDNPLCAANPDDNGKNTLQVRAKAYPGTRELRVVKETQGVAASICASQVTNPSADDYAYRPAVRAIIERMQACLKAE